MTQVIKLLIATGLSLVLSACMMAPVKPEFRHLSEDIGSSSSIEGESRLVFFNSSNKLMYGLDSTGRINVWLNGKAVGGPDIGEYVQVQVPKGKHQLTLVHLDMFEFKSLHELEVSDDPLYVEVWATLVSNDFKVHKSLPEGNYLPKPFKRHSR